MLPVIIFFIFVIFIVLTLQCMRAKFYKGKPETLSFTQHFYAVMRAALMLIAKRFRQRVIRTIKSERNTLSLTAYSNQRGRNWRRYALG